MALRSAASRVSPALSFPAAVWASSAAEAWVRMQAWVSWARAAIRPSTSLTSTVSRSPQAGLWALPAPSGEDANRAILAALREHGLALLPWSKEAESLRNRLSFLHRGLGEPWPDVSDAALIARLDAWLEPFLTGAASFAAIDAGALSAGLVSLVPHDLQRRVESLAPTHFDAPSGSRVPIRYDGDTPVLAIRVQELFGLDRHPAIAGGAVPLTLELLSPAHRPIQTTRDLPGFWRGSWADVRADMRGRYPKHVWPENPLEAAATSRAKPRGT